MPLLGNGFDIMACLPNKFSSPIAKIFIKLYFQGRGTPLNISIGDAAGDGNLKLLRYLRASLLSEYQRYFFEETWMAKK